MTRFLRTLFGRRTFTITVKRDDGGDRYNLTIPERLLDRTIVILEDRGRSFEVTEKL